MLSCSRVEAVELSSLKPLEVAVSSAGCSVWNSHASHLVAPSQSTGLEGVVVVVATAVVVAMVVVVVVAMEAAMEVTEGMWV